MDLLDPSNWEKGISDRLVTDSCRSRLHENAYCVPENTEQDMETEDDEQEYLIVVANTRILNKKVQIGSIITRLGLK